MFRILILLVLGVGVGYMLRGRIVAARVAQRLFFKKGGES